MQSLYKEIKDSPILVYPPIHSIVDRLGDEKRNALYQDLKKVPDKERKAVLYLHIPFCKTKCTFCTYDSIVAKEGKTIIQEYLNRLYQEMDAFHEQVYIQNLKFESAFIGGGSPSMLSASQLEALLIHMKQSFPIDKLSEFTIELELRTMTEKKLEICRKYGVTRISFGWQTFAKQVRKISALLVSEEELKEKIALLKKYQYSINADLIYGMPLQTFDDWKEDISKAIEYGFTGMDLFKCEIVPPAPMYNLCKEKHWKIVSKDEKRDMFLYAIEELKKQGFCQDSYQHFYHPEAPESMHRYNSQMMMSSYDTIALGPSSYGTMAGWVYRNEMDLQDYIYGEHHGGLNTVECAYHMKRSDWVERDFVQGLTRALVLPKDLVIDAMEERYFPIIKKLEEHGLLCETETEYRLTNDANGYVFNIASEFMSKENKKRIFSFYLMHAKHQK